MTEETHEPDGFVIIHYPLDGSKKYGIGPYPHFEELAQRMLKSDACSCRKEVLYVAFPAGVTMVVAGVADTETIREAVREVVDAVIELRKEESHATDRLN